MILVSVILILLAVFGAPLFTVIAASAMLGYQFLDHVFRVWFGNHVDGKQHFSFPY